MTTAPGRSRSADTARAPAGAAVGRPYFAIALMVAATVSAGFWPSYFGPLFRGAADKPWIIHVHAAVFLGWVILLVTETSLLTTGRPDLHRRLGRFGIAYGSLLFCVGLIVSVAAPALRVRAGQLPVDRAALVVLYNLTDILVFGAFFAAAIVKRRQREAHKRLILSATVALTGAAVGRVLDSGSIWYLLVWLAPLLASVAIDLATTRRIHRISLVSLAVFVVVFFKVDIYSALPFSRAVGRALLEPFV